MDPVAVLKGGDQPVFNHLMSDDFRLVDEVYNLNHIERTALAIPIHHCPTEADKLRCYTVWLSKARPCTLLSAGP